MIPENKQAGVAKALQTAFGVNEVEYIEQLMKGLSSALVFKIIVRGNPYLLRVITSTHAMNDPTHYFRCMQVAAEALIAPPIYYLTTEDRISITGFVQEKTFSIDEARQMMPYLLRQLHALPKFSYRINYFDAMEGFMEKFRASNMLPKNAIENVFEIYQNIVRVYPRDDRENWVSCHNDLKPENILFDGLRPWLIDWEGAFLNDRYLDLAVVANFVVKDDKDEADYLEIYFGEPAYEYRQARFFLMSQVLHFYYFGFLMLSGFTGKPVDVNNFSDPGFKTFHNRIWDGEINLADNDIKLQYAWVHREEFLRKVQTKRFADSLRIVAGQNKLH